MDTLGKNIRKQRLEHGWSQVELAEKVGVTAAYIGMLERSEKEPKLSTLIRIANTFGTGIDPLLAEHLTSQQAVICSDYISAITALPPATRQTLYALLDILIAENSRETNDNAKTNGGLK